MEPLGLNPLRFNVPDDTDLLIQPSGRCLLNRFGWCNQRPARSFAGFITMDARVTHVHQIDWLNEVVPTF